MPETWKPPITTGMPAARSGRAMSSARGYWFDCTPTRPTRPKFPSRLKSAMSRSIRTRVLVSSIGVHFDVDVRAEHLALGGLHRDPVDRRERIRRHEVAEPADDVAVVVVMRRLDQHDAEAALRAGGRDRAGVGILDRRRSLPPRIGAKSGPFSPFPRRTTAVPISRRAVRANRLTDTTAPRECPPYSRRPYRMYGRHCTEVHTACRVVAHPLSRS